MRSILEEISAMILIATISTEHFHLNKLWINSIKPLTHSKSSGRTQSNKQLGWQGSQAEYSKDLNRVRLYLMRSIHQKAKQ